MSLRDKACALSFATLGMLGLPVATLALRNVGPAARVVFRDYLPLEELAIVLLAAVVGAAVGADVPHRLWPGAYPAGRRWLRRGRVLGLALVALVAVIPQLRAFPARASLRARDAWARERVRHYSALTRVVAAIPEVQHDVGRVVAMAPSASYEHVFAREMNGDDMRFTLDVVGERGRGTFQAICTLDDYTVYDWQPGHWHFGQRDVAIEHVPERVPR
jgi:hypothetical protein